MGTQRSTRESTRIKIGSVEFRGPADQNMSLEGEELNRGIKASELLSPG
jgi:hypothetical protein